MQVGDEIVSKFLKALGGVSNSLVEDGISHYLPPGVIPSVLHLILQKLLEELGEGKGRQQFSQARGVVAFLGA